MKKKSSIVPICILALVVFFQLHLFLAGNVLSFYKSNELNFQKKAVYALFTDGAKDYRSPKYPSSDPLYIFAQQIDTDIPPNSKILYLNSTTNSANMIIYLQINTFIPRNHDAYYVSYPKPTVGQLINLMKNSKSQYLVDYNNQDIIDKEGRPIKGKHAIYRVNNNNLEVYKQYD